MLKQRVITALALIFVFGAVTILLPPFWFSLLICAIILCAGWEWTRFAGLRGTVVRLGFLSPLAAAAGWLFALLGIAPSAESPHLGWTAWILAAALPFWLAVLLVLVGYPDNRDRWRGGYVVGAIGLLALLPSLVGVVYLKYLAPAGYLVLALVVLVAAVDIGAYFAGRRFGRRQLAPAISPKKTWEGVWGGGALCAALAAAMIALLHYGPHPLSGTEVVLLAALALVTAALCVIGDLLESMLKRNCDAKDSGSMLPGHGGLLDRVDGLLAATPAFALGMMWLLQGGASP